MTQYFKNNQFPAGNPLANALVVIVGALAIGASLVLGIVVFIALGSIVAVLAAIIGIRIWWMNRRLRRQFPDGPATKRRTDDVRVIEGEYRVVSRDRREPPDPD